ncbi:hypothetical protein C8R45DRAFT_1033753, partial [Mycena sanguinolenta]
MNSMKDAEDTNTTYSKPRFTRVLPFVVHDGLSLRLVLLIAFWLALPSREHKRGVNNRARCLPTHAFPSSLGPLRLHPSMRISPSSSTPYLHAPSNRIVSHRIAPFSSLVISFVLNLHGLVAV